MTSKLVIALLVAAALGITLLWPGDASWCADEPRLLAEAWHANHDMEFARGGLWGNFGIRYGPLPTWIYQALLLTTHDPATLLLIRALLCAGTTAAALLWLARELRLPAWFAAAILVAPYVVQYHRLMWDASFAMPLSALTLAAFASFLRTRSRGTLCLTVAGLFLLPTIHPQALPFALPLLGWLLWRHRPALRAHWKPLVALLLVLMGTHAVWFVEAVFGFVHNLSGSVKQGYPDGASRVACALAPLLGGNLIGSPRIVAQVGAKPGLVQVALWGLFAIYPLVWFGCVVTARRFGSLKKPREIVGAVAVVGLVLQAVLFGIMRIPAGPQYFFGTFALHAVLAWLAVDELRTYRLGPILGATFGVCAVVTTLGLAAVVHRDGFASSLGWPTLKSQAAVARELNSFSDTRALTDVKLFQQYPQSLRSLRLLMAPRPNQSQRESGRLFITNPRTGSGEVVLHQRDTGSGEAMDVTPLPKGWQPATW